MLTIRDAEDAALAGWMDFQKAFQEFINEWYLPMQRMDEAMQAEKIVQMWDKMPAQMHATMARANPEMHAEITRRVNEIKKQGGYYARQQ